MQVRHKSQNSTVVFGLNYVLPKDAVTILRGLGEEKPQAIIAKQGAFKKQKVNYWTKAYLERGLIREKSIGKPKIYTLTAVGTTILTRSDRTFSQPCIMEDYPVKFELVSDSSHIEWVKLGEPRNWEKLGIHVGNVRVEKTSQSVIIHSGQLSGFNEYYLMMEAGQIHAIVRAWLLDHGVELGQYGVPLHAKPIFKFYNQAADLFNQLFGTVETENGAIDHSPPDNIPHIEFKGPRTAANFIDMGNKVAIIEQRLEGLEGLGRVLEANVKALEAIPGLGKLVETTTETLKQNSQVIQQTRQAIQQFNDFMNDLTAPKTENKDHKDPMLV